MDFISLLIAEPVGFWETIIVFFESFILDYAWAIIVLTICIKIVLTPLDFMNKKVARDNMRMQEVVAPQLQKLQKQYANDRMKLNQKTQELYKGSGYNMVGSCVIMLINLILTIVIFFTLFSALHTISSYKIEQQFLQLQQAYGTAYTEEIDLGHTEIEATEAGENAVLTLYSEVQNSFLWVQNIWVPDNPWTNSILTYEAYVQAVGSEITEEEYNEVMGILIAERSGVNGYLITAMIAILTCFFSQYLMQKMNKSKASRALTQNTPADSQRQTNKILIIILPIVMGVFTLFYNAIFGLYIIASQVVSLATFPLIDKLLNIYYNKKDKNQAQKIKMDYSRK